VAPDELSRGESGHDIYLLEPKKSRSPAKGTARAESTVVVGASSGEEDEPDMWAPVTSDPTAAQARRMLESLSRGPGGSVGADARGRGGWAARE
jgi:hypothetical protein